MKVPHNMNLAPLETKGTGEAKLAIITCLMAIYRANMACGAGSEWPGPGVKPSQWTSGPTAKKLAAQWTCRERMVQNMRAHH